MCSLTRGDSPGENLDAVFARLNDQQRKAVDAVEGPLLIIAGAGSGKTGVITARIARMLNLGIPQSSILALTFTNKAAREMVERIKKITGRKLSRLTVSTFHAFGVRILREKTEASGYRPNFSIYDASDRFSALQESVRELRLTHEPGEINQLINLFSAIKTRRTQWDMATSVHKELYDEYHELMKLHNAVDFDDLILRPLELFEKNPEVLEAYRNRYRYVMVDEFQDTSGLQYQLVKQIASVHRNLCCVGDDDQSIYSWRGANYANIVNFEKDFAERQEITLDRNYRSTGIILQAANAVISHNQDRKNKVLWTPDRQDEVTIQFSAPGDDKEEGQFIAETIGTLRMSDALPYDEIGILVRTNSLIRSLEEALLSHNLPYAVSGGTSFFSRREIKDMVGYLRVVDNPDDDVNLLRIVNVPRRGIGKTALKAIVERARGNGRSLYWAIADMVRSPSEAINSKTQGGLAEFLDLIEHFRDLFHSKNSAGLASTFLLMLEEIGYWGHLVQEFQHNAKIAQWRYENILAFGEFLQKWEDNPDNTKPTLTRWLNRITLNARDALDDDDAGKINLMTIHASKGLEFDVVFLPGVEEGLIPHAKSVEENPRAIEEERRLFYVAITRAKSKLYVSACRSRRIRQETITCVPSSFLEEIPENLMENAVSEEPVSPGAEASVYFAKMPWK